MAAQTDNILVLPLNSGLTELIATTDHLKLTAGFEGPVGTGATSTGAFTTLTAGTSLGVTGDASISGDLVVEGQIISSGTTDSITKDAVIDLLHGNVDIANAKAGGLTANIWPSNATNVGNAAGLAVAEFKIAGAAGTVDAQVEMLNVVAQVGASVTGNFVVTGIASVGDTFTIGMCAGDQILTAVAAGAGANEFNVGGDVNAQGTNLATAIAAVVGLETTDGGAGTNTFTIDACTTVNLGSGQNGRTAVAAQVGIGSVFAVTVPAAFAGGTGLSEGMFIEIADAVSTQNDGLFQIAGIAGNLIDVAGGSNAVSTNAPWCQTAFIVEVDTAAKVRAINLAALAFSNGVLTDQSGGAVTIGSVCDSYTGQQLAAATSVPAMARDVFWTVSGSDSMQAAYNVGNDIITTAGRPIDFTLLQDAAGFSVQGNAAGDGIVSIGGGTAVDSIVLAGNGTASSWTSTGANLSLSTATTGNLTLTSASALDLNAGAAATIDATDTSSFTMAAAVALAKSLDFSATNSAGGGTAGITIDADDTVSSTTGVHTFASSNTSSWVLNGVAQTLKIESTDTAGGGGAQKLLLASDGSGADALQMASTGGGFDLASIGNSTISSFAPNPTGVNTSLTISATNADAARTASLVLSADDILSATSDTITITAGLDSTWSMAADIAADHTLSILATNANAGGDAGIDIKAQGEAADGILIENDGGGSAAAGILINAKNTGDVSKALAKVSSEGDIELDADYNMLLDAALTLNIDCVAAVPTITTSKFTNGSGSAIGDGMCVTLTGTSSVSAADAQAAAGKVPLSVAPASWANAATAPIGTFLGSTVSVRIMEAHSRGWLEVANNGTLTAGDSITINGQAPLAAPGDWAIGGSAAATAANIVTAINGQAGNQVFAIRDSDKVLLQSTETAVATTQVVTVTNAGCLTLSAATLVKVGADDLTGTGASPAAGSIVYLASSTDPTKVAGGGFTALAAPSGSGDSVIRIGTVVDPDGGGLGTKAAPDKALVLWNTQFIANHP